MKQQDILQELRRHGGSLAVAAANEIETLAAKNAELEKSLGALTTAYNKLLDHMPEWIDVKERLPKATDKYGWVPLHRNGLGVSVSDLNIR